MKIQIEELRRERLRLWTAKNGVPKNEKSYISQLLGGASFGEKAARRLEKDYKMGDRYLDMPIVEDVNMPDRLITAAKILTVLSKLNAAEVEQVYDFTLSVEGSIAAQRRDKAQ